MKKLTAAIIPGATFLTFASTVFAGSVKTCANGSTFDVLCDLTPTTFVPKIITLLFVIAIVVAVLYLIWGGIKWITSGGDKAGLQAAREHVIAAVVGLVVVFLSYFLINFVLTYFLNTTISSGNFGEFGF